MIRANSKRLVNEFLRLVQIDSETGNERAICDYLIDVFTGLGCMVEEDDSAVETGLGSGNLYILLPATDPEREPVLLSAHMDTVPPGIGVKPRIDEDGYIRSDGTTVLGSDDKAGIAAIIEAVRLSKESGQRHGPVELLISAGEEAGLLGLKTFKRPLQSRRGYVLDASGPVGKVNVSEAGKTKLIVEVTGKAAHSTMPEQGVNAIVALMKGLSACSFGRLDDITVANVGVIEGGTADNIVPESARATLEVRSLSQDRMEQALAQLSAIVEPIVRAAGATVSFTQIRSCDTYRIEDDSPVLRLAREAIGNSVREQIPIAELEKAAELAYALMEGESNDPNHSITDSSSS